MNGNGIPYKDYTSEYKLEERIGEGSKGRVYLALTARGGSPVILKFLEKSSVDEQDILSEYNVKIAIRKHCEQRGIKYLVCYKDLFRTSMGGKNYYVIVMDYVKGENLSSLLERKGATEQDKIVITESLLRAVNVLHDAMLAHRDINPDNIVYDKEGKRAVLIDYGLTCSLGRIKNGYIKPCECELWRPNSFTDPSLCSGKRRSTIAPGYLRDNERDTHSSHWMQADLYSVGIILLLLWSTNEHPLANIQRSVAEIPNGFVRRIVDGFIGHRIKARGEYMQTLASNFSRKDLFREFDIGGGEPGVEDLISQYM